VQAEDSGFDSVAISDHFQPWRHTGGHRRMPKSRSPGAAPKQWRGLRHGLTR
jgi:alkanesulfonate monooxygenase SsuD/methylene tetrahydromethanopterin reductase-like flavin-dependent oxidoreductase (luciferase family)